MPTKTTTEREWCISLTDRERAEIEFSELYQTNYGHGTDGHNAKLIIAKLAKLLDGREAHIKQAIELLDENEASNGHIINVLNGAYD